MQSPFTLQTSTVLIALSLVVVPLAGAAAQKGGAAPRAAPSTPRSVIVPRLPEYYDPAGKQNTAPTYRERLRKRISLQRRLHRSDAELQRMIAAASDYGTCCAVGCERNNARNIFRMPTKCLTTSRTYTMRVSRHLVAP